MAQTDPWSLYVAIRGMTGKEESKERGLARLVTGVYEDVRRFAEQVVRGYVAKGVRACQLDSDDLASEALRLFCLKLDRIDGNPRAYVFGTVKRLALAKWSRREDRAHEVISLDDPGTARDEVESKIIDLNVQHLEESTRFLNRDSIRLHAMRERLWQSVRELPRIYRNIIVHVFFWEMSYPEIAKRCAITEQTARKRKQRAIQLLHRRLNFNN